MVKGKRLRHTQQRITTRWIRGLLGRSQGLWCLYCSAPGASVSQLLPGGIWDQWAKWMTVMQEWSEIGLGCGQAQGAWKPGVTRVVLTTGISRPFPLVAVDVQGTESWLKEWRGRDVRKEINLEEVYFEGSVDLVLKWRAKLSETYLLVRCVRTRHLCLWVMADICCWRASWPRC